MTLKETIQRDMRSALKNREEAQLSALRMLIAALESRAIEQRGKSGSGDLADDDVLAVVRSEAKKCRDAAEEFKKGGRLDLSEKELMDLRLFESYLPPEMSDEEIGTIVREVVQGEGDTSDKNFGRIMGQVMKRVHARARGDRVLAVVQDVIGQTKR